MAEYAFFQRNTSDSQKPTWQPMTMCSRWLLKRPRFIFLIMFCPGKKNSKKDKNLSFVGFCESEISH
jgi:hypothetical protein